MATVKLDLAKCAYLADQAAEAGLRKALGEAETILKADVLNRAGTGRDRPNGNGKASSPGQPPAPDTGNLRTSTNADTEIRKDGEDQVGSVVANAAYAEALELGTERMAARPYLGRLATEHAAQLALAFTEGAKQ